jgi:hypothetical protein
MGRQAPFICVESPTSGYLNQKRRVNQRNMTSGAKLDTNGREMLELPRFIDSLVLMAE